MYQEETVQLVFWCFESRGGGGQSRQDPEQAFLSRSVNVCSTKLVNWPMLGSVQLSSRRWVGEER